MPLSGRYFFHLVSPHEVIPDEEGVDMSTGEEALSQILQAVNEFIKEALSCDEWQGWSLEITDGIGSMVLSIPLTDFDQTQSPLH
jgi:hypothetical protein